MAKKAKEPKKIKEVKLNEKNIGFRPDQGLMYLIQQTTKQSSDEILGFFFDFGRQVLKVGLENMTGSTIRKDIRDIYPGTAIPFKILVEGGNRYWQNNEAHGTIYISFPDNPEYIDSQKIIEFVMERELLGQVSMPEFEQPSSRTPKLYKDFIAQVLNKQEEKKKSKVK